MATLSLLSLGYIDTRQPFSLHSPLILPLLLPFITGSLNRWDHLTVGVTGDVHSLLLLKASLCDLSSEPSVKRICHWDGHFNWTINFWRDSPRYLDEQIPSPPSKTQIQSFTHTSDSIFMCTISTNYFWSLFLEIALRTSPISTLWLNNWNRKRLVETIVKNGRCYVAILQCLLWSPLMARYQLDSVNVTQIPVLNTPPKHE